MKTLYNAHNYLLKLRRENNTATYSFTFVAIKMYDAIVSRV